MSKTNELVEFSPLQRDAMMLFDRHQRDMARRMAEMVRTTPANATEARDRMVQRSKVLANKTVRGMLIVDELATDVKNRLQLSGPKMVFDGRDRWVEQLHDDRIKQSEGKGWHYTLLEDTDEWAVWRNGDLMAKCYCERDADVLVDLLRDQACDRHRERNAELSRQLFEAREQIVTLEARGKVAIFEGRLQNKEADLRRQTCNGVPLDELKAMSTQYAKQREERKRMFERSRALGEERGEVLGKPVERGELVVMRGTDMLTTFREVYEEWTEVDYDPGAMEPTEVIFGIPYGRSERWTIRWEGKKEPPPVILMGPMKVKWP